MKVKKALTILCFSALCLPGCKNKFYKYDLMFKNLSKAKTVFVATKGSSKTRAKKSNDDMSTLYMTTEDGTVEEVLLSFIKTTKNNKYVEKGSPSNELDPPIYIKPINDEFMMAYYSGRYYYSKDYTWVEEHFLINRSTGRCYKIPENSKPSERTASGGNVNDFIPTREKYFVDRDGFIYYVSTPIGERNDSIVKIDPTDPLNLTARTVSLINDNLDKYLMPTVTKSGKIAYDGTNNGNSVSRLVNKDGSFLNIPFGNHSYDYWVGYDDEIYTFDYSAGNYRVVKLVVKENAVSLEQYGDEIHEANYAGYYNLNENCGRHYLDKQKKIVVFGVSGIVEVYNEETNNTKEVSYESLGIKRPKIHVNSGEYFYLYAENENRDYSLYKIDPQNDYSKVELFRNKYDITSFVVGDDETITFNGLRYSDGAYVFGEIDKNGNEQIFEEVFNTKVESLTLIN